MDHRGYSAKVSLSLIVAGIRLKLAQVCPKLVYLFDPAQPHEPTMATLVINVDGRESNREIFLHDGIGDQLEIAYF